MARDSSGRRAPAGPRPAGRLLDLRLRRLLLVGAVTAVTLAGTLGTQRSLESAAAGRGAPATGRGAQWQGWGQWQAGRERIDALAVLLLLAGPAFLLLRRRPMVTAVGAVGAAALYIAAGYVLGPVLLSAAVALVWAVGAGTRVQAWVVAAGGWAVAVLGSQLGPEPLELTSGLGFVVWVVALLAVADVVRGRRERAAAEARAREEERLRQVSEERLRIARDLHDGVAHHISLISVRAGVAVHLLDSGDAGGPAQAREALATIRQASSEALAELRSALGALRADGEKAPRHPVPGLVAGAPALVERWRAAGLEVTLDGLPAPAGAGVPASLPGAVDQAAYRVLQESLTNVSRHSAARTVAVRWSPADGGPDGAPGRGSNGGPTGTATLTVTDPGPRLATQQGGGHEGGRGVRGMHERVEMLGGTLVAGPHGAGWQVRAVLPIEGAP